MLSLSLCGLAVLIAFALAGSASAHRAVRPVDNIDVRALRAQIDHYRLVTWTFERAASARETPTSFSYRRSTDHAYLAWTRRTWSARADATGDLALARIGKALHVALPRPAARRSALATRVAAMRRLTLALRRIYPGSVARGFAAAHGTTPAATFRLWQARLAAATLTVARHGYAHPPAPAWLVQAFQCIHRYEGAWTSNTGNGYYGGLQMDVPFQAHYGGSYLARWGTADNWPVWAQVDAAVRAYRSGRGFGPWPNTARACGLV